MCGSEKRALHQAALHLHAGHSFHGQSERWVKPLLKPQVEQPSRRHAQGQRSKRIDKQSRQKPGHRLWIMLIDTQDRATPLQAKRSRYQLLAHALTAHQPNPQPAASRLALRLYRAS
jgi:hypothetical protein